MLKVVQCYVGDHDVFPFAMATSSRERLFVIHPLQYIYTSTVYAWGRSLNEQFETMPGGQPLTSIVIVVLSLGLFRP